MTGHRTVGIIVARMDSTRVPAKSLLDIAGKPLVVRMIDIARAIRGFDEVSLATSSLAQDDPLAAAAAASGIRAVRGDPERVLDRIHQAVGETRAEVIVYLGGDCPLLDPAVIEQALANFRAAPCDYLNNYEPPTFPEGFDVNIVTRRAVEIAVERAIAPSQRVHAFSYLTRHPEQFVIRNFARAPDLSMHHWSIDFPEDVAFVRLVYERLYRAGAPIRLGEILDLTARDAEVAAMDAKLRRPVVQHAFWNSPGILRDMNLDIADLSVQAQAALDAADYARARLCYDEIGRIAAEMQRGTSRAR